jgi:hypothetical protein
MAGSRSETTRATSVNNKKIDDQARISGNILVGSFDTIFHLVQNNHVPLHVPVSHHGNAVLNNSKFTY